jgi:hypothetical protein
VARRAASLVTLTPNQTIAADASNNGSISGFDASLIARTAAGIANTGIAGQWKFVPASKTYSSLNANQTQNYEAILMGEVSGNWTAPTSFAPPEYPSEAERLLADQTEEQLYEESTRLSGLILKTEAAVKEDSAAEKGSNQSANQQASSSVSAPKAGISVALPANATASNRTTVLIPITVGETTGQNIFAFDFTVSFNKDVLQPASTSFDTAGTRAGAANFSITPNTGTEGKINIVGFSSNQPLSGSGTLIFLRFNVVGTAGTGTGMTNLTFDSFMFNEGEPLSKTTNGAFTVTGATSAPASLSGRVMMAKGVGIGNIRLTLTESNGATHTTLSDNQGLYSFTGINTGQMVIVSVQSGRFRFAQPTQVFNLTEDLTGVNFTAQRGNAIAP